MSRHPNLTEKDVMAFRQKLEENLKRTRETIAELTEQLPKASNRHDYNHNYGDTGSRTQEAERVAELLEREKTYLTDLEKALSRVENGTYGICEVSGEPIARKRLEAMPTATTTMAVARDQ